MNPGASPWSPQQRRWLQALGHAVLRVGGDVVDAPPEIDAAAAPVDQRPGIVAAARTAPVPEHPSTASPPSTPVRRPPPPATVDTARPDAAAARGAMRRPQRLPDRLQLALLRASALDPSDPAAQETMAQWPVDRLRGDGAAKRAFWPQLRALRRRP